MATSILVGCTLDVGRVFTCLCAGLPHLHAGYLRADLPHLHIGLPRLRTDHRCLRVVHPHMRDDLPCLQAGLLRLRTVLARLHVVQSQMRAGLPHLRDGLTRLHADLPPVRLTCCLPYSHTGQSSHLSCWSCQPTNSACQPIIPGVNACFASQACPATPPSYPPMVLLSACPPHYLEPS